MGVLMAGVYGVITLVGVLCVISLLPRKRRRELLDWVVSLDK